MQQLNCRLDVFSRPSDAPLTGLINQVHHERYERHDDEHPGEQNQ